jgi:hypothetical protein
MAFLWKHPASKYFMARFVDVNGKRPNRSTKSINRKEAEKIADAYEAASRKAHGKTSPGWYNRTVSINHRQGASVPVILSIL